MRWSIPAAAAAVMALASGMPPPVQAAPSFCTGTTNTVGSGGSVLASFLLTPGNCVEAGDKFFGAFSANSGITGTGSGSFTFLMTPGNVTLGFAGVVNPSTVGTINYTVAIDPLLSQGFLIENLEKDFTLNASLTGVAASATLTGSTTADPAFAFNCTRTVNPSSSTCPQTDVFGFVSQMTVDQTITTGTNAIVTGLTDTISQALPASEPSSLAMLGAGLAGLWLILRHRNKKGAPGRAFSAAA